MQILRCIDAKFWCNFTQKSQKSRPSHCQCHRRLVIYLCYDILSHNETGPLVPNDFMGKHYVWIRWNDNNRVVKKTRINPSSQDLCWYCCLDDGVFGILPIWSCMRHSVDDLEDDNTSEYAAQISWAFCPFRRHVVSLTMKLARDSITIRWQSLLFAQINCATRWIRIGCPFFWGCCIPCVDKWWTGVGRST